MTIELSDIVAISTVTRFRDNPSDKVREHYALQSIAEGIGLGYSIDVVDDGSSEAYLLGCERYGATVHVLPGASFEERTKHGIRKMLERPGKKILSRLEIEKPLMPYIASMAQPIADGVADLVIPHRGDRKEYPREQQAAETLGNVFFQTLTGLPFELDMWGGTRVWKRELSHHFLNYEKGQHEGYWNCYFVPVLWAIQDGARPMSVPINYVHPPEQTALEKSDFSFVKKRVVQLNQITAALEKEWLKKCALPGSANVAYK